MLFIDEIHRLNPAIEEILYPAVEDYQLDIMIGEGPRRVPLLDLPPLLWWGDDASWLTDFSLRDRFGIIQRLSSIQWTI